MTTQSLFKIVPLLLALSVFSTSTLAQQADSTTSDMVDIPFGAEQGGITLGGRIKSSFDYGEDIEIELKIRVSNAAKAYFEDRINIDDRIQFTIYIVSGTDLQYPYLSPRIVDDNFFALDNRTYSCRLVCSAEKREMFPNYNPGFGPDTYTEYVRTLPAGNYRCCIEMKGYSPERRPIRIFPRSGEFELKIADDQTRYEPFVVYFPTILKVDPIPDKPSRLIAYDSIIISRNRDFKTSFDLEAYGQGSLQSGSSADQILESISRIPMFFIPKYQVDSLSYCLRVHESSHGRGHMGSILGYGHRVLLEHEWYIKYIYDNIDTGK